MTQTKIHIQDGGSGVGEESAQESKEEEIKQVCVISKYTYTVMMDIIQVMFVCRHHCQN